MTEQEVSIALNSSNKEQLVALLNTIVEDQYDFTEGMLFINFISTVKKNKPLIKALQKISIKPSELFEIIDKGRFSVSNNQAFAEYLNYIISWDFEPNTIKAKAFDFFINYGLKSGNGIKLEFVTNELIKEGPNSKKAKSYIQSKIRGEEMINPFKYLEI